MRRRKTKTKSSDCLSLSNLPSNVISKIVQKLPVSYRKNFALTCKDFYKIVCHEDRFKYKMNIVGVEALLAAYDSVMASKRVFDEWSLRTWLSDESTLYLLTRIAAKHGSTVKKLNLGLCDQFSPSKIKLKVTQFQMFLKEFTNLIEFEYSGPPLEFDREPEPVLQNVKVFKANHFNVTEAFINNITKFMQPNTLENWDIHVEVPQIFQRQRNLKDILLFSNSYCSSTDYKHLKLERIEFYNHRDENSDVINQVIRDHAETLKKIRASTANSRTLDIICNQCTNLENLWLTVNEENATSLLQISRLKKLKELRINFDENFQEVSTLVDVANIKMMNIKKLIFEKFNSRYDVQLPEEILDNFSKNWPNIEEFSLSSSFLTLNRVVMKFQKLEVIDFSGFYMYDGHVHPGLKKIVFHRLSITETYFPPYMTTAFPNLKSLKVKSCYFLGVSQLKALNEMKKLKELDIEFRIHSEDFIVNAEDIKELKKLMHRLEACEITFIGSFNFIDGLAEQLKGEALRFESFSDIKSLGIKIKY